jgi:peroxiredoxin
MMSFIDRSWNAEGKQMTRKTVRLAMIIGMALVFFCGSGLAAGPLRVGSRLGNLKFPQTLTPADQAYLGLKRSGNFTLRDIGAQYVLIEIINAYCPHCMDQAPILNRLFRMVEDSNLKNRLKFIGVVSNPVSEVANWRKTYKVPFALVADPDWQLADVLAITGTPTTVVVDKSGKVIIFHDGFFADARQAFRQLKARLK